MKCSEVVGTLYRDGEILFESKEKEEAFTTDVVSCEELRACCEKITSAARQPKEPKEPKEEERHSSFYNGRLRCVKSYYSSFFKVGNIYECIDGEIMSDAGISYPRVGSPYRDFADARFAGCYDARSKEPWLTRHDPYYEFEEVE